MELYADNDKELSNYNVTDLHSDNNAYLYTGDREFCADKDANLHTDKDRGL
jgi:hypothetical protein